MKPNEDYNDWIEYVKDRKIQDYRYYIDTIKLQKLG
jgi:dTDP-D-glucose 4,6-dehydratase